MSPRKPMKPGEAFAVIAMWIVWLTLLIALMVVDDPKEILRLGLALIVFTLLAVTA